MADNIPVTPSAVGGAKNVATDEMVDADLGGATVHFQYTKIADGTPGSNVKAKVTNRGLQVDTNGDTPTRTSVDASETAVTLKAANPNRNELVIYNNSPATLYVGFGSTDPTLSDWTLKLGQDEFVSTGTRSVIKGIWAAGATGTAKVTEIV